MEDKQRLEEKKNKLLRVIAEQNDEKLLGYDAASDEAFVYKIVDDRFEMIYRIPGYIHGSQVGEVFITPEDKKKYQRAVRACLKKPTHVVVDAHFMEKGKKPEWHRFYLVSVAGKDGSIAYIVGRFLSVHREKVLYEKIKRRAEIDALTNVYNHMAFEEICARSIRNCKSNAFLLMLDIDDFKIINDTQGHAVGDLVLSQTGEVLRKVVGDRGIAGRLGGDEFAAFVWNFSDRGEMEEFCVKLKRKLKSIIFDMEYSASMGVSILGSRSMSFQELYYEADQAVYEAKRKGKNRIIFYQDVEQTIGQQAQTKGLRPQVKASGNANDILERLQQCLELIGSESYDNGVTSVLFSLVEFFDADYVSLVYGQRGNLSSFKESHKESASEMASRMRKLFDSGELKSMVNFVVNVGEIRVENVISLEKDHKKLYDLLTTERIWSMAASSISEQDDRACAMFVLNPRRHFEEASLLHMIESYLHLRILQDQMAERQEYDKTHDKLTGLWNRSSYTQWMKLNKNSVFESYGVITTDVIHLSEINRQFGYMNGNKRLVEVADVLLDSCGSFQCFRYDEDEMVVICPDITRGDMELLVGKVRQKLNDLEVGVAVGYSWSANPRIRAQVTEAEVVMNNDKLKKMHGSELAKRMEQSVIDEVTDLMNRGHYLVYLQPKVNIHTGRTEGAEALIRQLDDELGIVGPGVFIPILERYNLVHMIDLYVLEQIFMYQQEQIDLGHRTIPISVNFSKMTIIYPELVEKVKALTEKYPVPTGLIHIEVTETIGDMDHVVIEDVANSLKQLGFRLSMDDFGSHYSNLSVLIQYDFDSAKIDRSMVMEITKSQKSRMVLDYMTSLINDLGIHCIVEGIETKEQVEILKKTKAEMIQGFYFGKPVPKEEFYDAFMGENMIEESDTGSESNSE